MALVGKSRSPELRPGAKIERRPANFAHVESQPERANNRQENAATNRGPDTEALRRRASAAAMALPAQNEVQLLEIEKILEGGDDSQLGVHYATLSETGKGKFRTQGEALCRMILGELDRELKTPERKGLRLFMHEVMTVLIPTRDFRYWTLEQVEGWLTRNGVSQAFAEQHAEIAMQKFATLLKNERERSSMTH